MHNTMSLAANGIRLAITYGIQLLTALMLLASSIHFFADTGLLANVRYLPDDKRLHEGLGLTIAASGLWFLIPGFFNRTLENARDGFFHFVINLWFLVVLGYIIAFSYVLTHSNFSPIHTQFQLQLSYVLMAAFIVLYLYSFYIPGRAFTRHDQPDDEAIQIVYTDTARTYEPVSRSTLLGRLLALVVYSLIGFGYWGHFYATWMPTGVLLDQVAGYWQVIVAGVCVLCALMYFTTDTPRRSLLVHSPIAAKAVIYLATMTMAALAVTPAVTKGLPWAVSFVPGTDAGSAVVIVQARGSLDNTRACDRTAMVTHIDFPARPVKLCAIPLDIWQTLKRGDRLRLDGPQTLYGLRYTEISREEAN